MKFGKFFGDIQGYLIDISSVDIQGIYIMHVLCMRFWLFGTKGTV